MPHPIHIVDVFAERPYAGNQLAVVIGDDLPDEVMQQVAAETNYSETTFINPKPEHDQTYRVRIFTPARELPFAGHPILGTAWVIRHFVATGRPEALGLKLKVGEIPVTFETSSKQEIVWFAAPPASFGPVCDRAAMARALGLAAEDIDDRAPAQQLSAGTPQLLVPLRKRDALRRARLDLEAFASLAGSGFPALVYLFCSETRHRGNDVSARFFFEAHGVREDPATGSASSYLGHYLLKYPLMGNAPLSLRIEQGDEVGRPSLIHLRARTQGSAALVHVGGRVIATMEGQLL